MIRLGYGASAKAAEVSAYCAAHDIQKVVAISPARFRVTFGGPAVECIEWAEVIQYKHFYRLVQEIDGRTLVVVNECLRTQSRHDLTYNCIRHFLNQTTHQIVFQRLPIVDSFDDFMTLVDFDTRSRWKRAPFDPKMLAELDVKVERLGVELEAVEVKTDARTKAHYDVEKRRLLDGIGLRDPHTIPRTLHLLGGKAKAAVTEAGRHYVGRNDRLGVSGLVTYREAQDARPRDVFEFCHDFLTFSDFLAVTEQRVIRALVSDLRVDRWYFDRFAAWAGRVRDAYATLLG